MTEPTATDLFAHLSTLGFQPPLVTEGRLSIADLVPLRRRRGLYVLHAGDEHYLGRTESFPRRYREHLVAHPDVRAVSLLHVPVGDLHETEQRHIRDLEGAGYRLRNSAGMSMPLVAVSDLDDLVSPADQERWRAGETVVWHGRSRDETVRRRQAKKGERFARSPHAPEVLALLRTFVEACVIAPGLTEISLWSVTAFAHGCRVNAGWQEVFRTLDGRDYFLLVAPSVLAAHVGSGWDRQLESLGVTVVPQMYRFPGHDNAGLFVTGAGAMRRLLGLPGVIPAAREVTWRCMRKAPNPNGRSHAPQLVDWLSDVAENSGERE